MNRFQRWRAVSTCCSPSPEASLRVETILRHQGLNEALDHIEQSPSSQRNLNTSTFARLLLACGNSASLPSATRLHRLIPSPPDPFLASHLVHAFLKCGSFQHADPIFRSIPPHAIDVSTSTAILVARATLGLWTDVFNHLKLMQMDGTIGDKVMLVALLTACTKTGALAQANLIYGLLQGTGLESDVGVLNVMLNMYGKAGLVDDAQQAFERMSWRDVVSWTVMIGAYARAGQLSAALRLFEAMQHEGTRPNKVTFVSVLSAFQDESLLRKGRLVHVLVIESGLESQVVVANSLLGMYSRCSTGGRDAVDFFHRMPVKDVVSWTKMIATYSQLGSEQALVLYHEMLLEGVMPTALTFSMLLEACGSLSRIKPGRAFHEQLVQKGLESELVGISLVNMYSKCGCLEEARGVFDRVHGRDRVLWNSMITAYQEKDPREALSLFRRMQPEAVTPDRITFMTVLNACTKLVDLEQGRIIHERITATGFLSDVYVATALFNMYARCGSLPDAQKVFGSMKVRDMVSWNNIITVYVEHQHGRAALLVYRQMQLEGMRPNKSTFASLLNACSAPDSLENGRRIHSCIVESGLEGDIVMVTAIITMYAGCGSLEEARKMFDGVFLTSNNHHGDLILWTSMITAYEQQGEFRQALQLYQQMHARKVEPDRVTFISVLNACAHLTDLRQGRVIHARVIRSGLETDLGVANSVIFMYGRCGSFGEAGPVFEKLHPKDLALWSCMISAYAQHGHGDQAGHTFRRMRQDGCELSDVTFIAILSACGHTGLVEEGCEFFASMAEHGIEPTQEIYGCMVDLLARAGHLDITEEFIEKMAEPANSVILTAFLAACTMHGDVEMGRRVAEKLEALDPMHNASYVTLCSIELQRDRT